MACAAAALSGEADARDAQSAAPSETPRQSPANPDASQKPADKKPTVRFDIDEYRIEGADAMRQIDVEEAVYPFLGPGRTPEDVEKARAALEKAYASKGYQTVSVTAQQQNPDNGIVVLKVSEIKVGRLRVKNSRYFDLEKIKDKAPSVAEGKLPNFNAVTKDIVSLNQWPDRKVTPVLRAGATPGTVDVDLNVEDKLPLHASVELNNRQSPNTTPLRLVSNIRYENLWQRGDSINFSHQIAPQRPDDVKVLSGSYLARTSVDWLNFLAYGVKSDSNVASVGGVNVVGPGQVVGGRALFTLPPRENFFHTVSLGGDYKSFGQLVSLQDRDGFSTPVTYATMTANYSASWQREGGLTQLNAGVTYGLRGIGSEPAEFDAKRYGAFTNFFYLRGDASHTQDIPHGFQIYGKLQGQVADQPLVSSEAFSIGGLDTVRGYLESESLGDTAFAGTVELRTPNIGNLMIASDADGKPQKPVGLDEWRFFVFADAGRVESHKPLPEQQSVFSLASYGIGTRIKLFNYANGMLVYAVPVIGQAFTFANHAHLTFRVWAEF